MIKQTNDKAAVVDTGIHWLDAKANPPPSGKMLCINREHGSAAISTWRAEFGFTHWAPLPTFKD